MFGLWKTFYLFLWKLIAMNIVWTRDTECQFIHSIIEAYNMEGGVRSA